MKILITGVAGTGKSTMSKNLKEKGFFAMDFSEVQGMCFWQDKNTKEKVDWSPIQSREWFTNKERICDLEKLKEVLSQHKDIIMSGVASGNQTAYLPFFDKVILLQCNPETFVYRMQTRTAPYGKTKAEQEEVIEWQKEFDPLILSYGAIPISTEGELNKTIDKVIAQITAFRK